MIKQKYLLFFGFIVALVIIGIIFTLFSSQKETGKLEVEEKTTSTSIIEISKEKGKLKVEEGATATSEIEVSICNLVNNPALYINKEIKIEAIVKFVGESYWAQKGNFFLEDGNCQMQVSSWVPITVAHCPPNVKDCKEPVTMANYLDKKVKLDGVLKELPKEEYINNKWTVVGTYYTITDVNNVLIVPSLISNIKKPPVVDHFACSDYCPGPQEKYMVKVYQGVEDEEECRKLGGKPSSYTGWGTTKICIVE